MLRAVIFDCDGVLFDSWRANVAYYNAVLRQMDLPPLSAEWEKRAHFMASSQVFDQLFADDPATLQQARQIARAIDYGPFYDLMEPAPGLYPLLASLKRSYRLAMASNRGTTVQEVMRRFKLDAYLDLAVGVLDVARPKPHPDMIEKCLSHFDVAPGAAVYVGDAESDLAAATAAGVHFVGVGDTPWTTRRVQQLHELRNQLADLTASR
ncbi:MAG: HAD-IA family hydrolase [Deltaproteobacteria bacterium]|nr:HAD-IA family hydrolase [Deltaproteobacteria bacterium]MBI3386190.1 HAD-IA family hydrolase [Deltaproteobacteria bacterium]